MAGNQDVNPDRVGIRMDVLKNILRDLNAHARLQQIFGVPVSAALAVVADGNDLRIEISPRVAVGRAEQKEFLRALDQVIAANGA